MSPLGEPGVVGGSMSLMDIRKYASACYPFDLEGNR